MKFFKLLIFTILYSNFISHSVGSQVRVFDVGQGNCVAVKYGNKVILIDAGSTESNYEALYTRASTLKEIKFDIAPIHAQQGMHSGSEETARFIHKSDTSQRSLRSSPSQESIEGHLGEADAKRI